MLTVGGAKRNRRTALAKERFWCGRAIPKRAMWPDSIVMSSPCLNQDLVFGKAVEDFAVKQLIAQAAVERFTGDMNTGGADRGCSHQTRTAKIAAAEYSGSSSGQPC